MKKLAVRELEHLLDAAPAGEPPPGLAERIKAEIPSELPAPALPFAPRRPVWHPHRWRLAAALVMVVGGGSLAWLTWREEPHQGSPRVEPAVQSRTSAPAATPAPRPESGSPGDPGAAADPARVEQRSAGEELEALRSLGYLDHQLAAEVPSPLAARRSETAPSVSPGAELEVTVLDPEDDPLPGAAVEVEGPGGRRRSATDAQGRAVFLGLPTGRYDVSADLDGFAGEAPAPVELGEEGAEARVQRTLTPFYGQEITVTAPAPLTDTMASTSGAAVGGSAGGPTRSEQDRRIVRDERPAAPKAPPPTPKKPRVQPVPEPEPRAHFGPAEIPGRRSAPPSTGGTGEPNDAPYGDVFFRHYGVNPFLDPEEDRLSTFALDADTGSWGVVSRYLADGHLPPPEAVRVEEIVNALDYGDPAPAGDDFALYAEGAPTPFGGGDRYRLLRFALEAREVDPADRKPAALTFVIDVSGSMAQENRLGLVKASLGLLLDELRADDRVGLVTYGTRGRVVLAPTADKEAIRAALERLVPEGSTNAEEGLRLGYEVASAALRPGAINRVILASDGVANVGATGPDSILARARGEAVRGIELTTLGFGMGNYNDVLMERLANDGDGRYAYINDLGEARRVLVEELTGTLQTVAWDARAQVELNPELVERYRLIGYENRDLADERFRDDTADAGEIGAGHTVTALYEIKLRESATGRAGRRAYRDAPVATLRLRWRPEGDDSFVERERPLLLGELAESWDAATPALRLAGLAAELAELLRGSYWARDGSLDDVFRRLQRLQPELAGDARAAELAAMAGQATRLSGGEEPGGGR